MPFKVKSNMSDNLILDSKQLKDSTYDYSAPLATKLLKFMYMYVLKILKFTYV